MMDIDFDDAEGEHLQAAASASASASASAGPSSSTATRTAALHRIRFVDYSPSPITSIALTPSTYDPAVHYPHLPSIDSPQGREILAVGRQNGDIEIYTWIGGMGGQKQISTAKGKKKRTEHAKGNRQGWVLERKLASPRPSRVEHLLFTHQVILSDSDKDLFDDAEQARELLKLRRSRPRLFSSGGGSDLWEWDWADGGLGYVKRTISSQGGAIWSMAANPTHTTLALGCDDGAVRLLDLWDGELEHVRKFDAVKTRLLSLAWGKRTPVPTTKGNSSTKGKQAANTTKDDGMDGDASDAASADAEEEEEARYEDSLLVTGCADSTVRVWDARSGRCVHRMTTDKVKGEHTLVWCLALLGDGTAVSGDSMGNVKFWDTRMGTQLQSCSASRADILCLALGTDGRTVYASGVDQKTTQIQLLDVEASRTHAHANAQGKRAQKQTQTQIQRRWVISTSKRMHSHDVRALAVSPAYTLSPSAPGPALASASSSSKVPVVISGGLDFSLIYSPAATLPAHARLPNPVSESSTTLFSESFQRKSAYIPQRALPAHLAGEGRLVVCRKESGQVDVWALPQAQAARAQAEGSAWAGTDGWSKVLEMELSGKTNLVASAISPDGRWLAVSDLSETKVFRLRQAADGAYRARRCHDVTAALTSQSALERDLGASQLHFTSDSSRLVLATAIGARIVVVSLPESSHEEASVLRVFNQHRLGSRQNTGRTVAGLPAQQANGEGEGEGAGSDSESSDDEDAEDNVISSIACLATSSDGQWLVSADSACRLHVFNLDSLQYHSPLPSLELPPSALAFSPSAPSILAVGLPNNTLQFFDVEKRSIPSWAKGISQAPSGALTTLREPMLGLAFDPTPALGAQREDTLLTYGATWLCKMKIPSASGAASSKRRRDGAEEESDEQEEEEENQPALLGRYKKTPVVVSHKYQPILLLNFTADGELVIVERPFFDLLGDMAPAFVERKYGS